MTIQEFKNKALAILKEKSPSPSLDIEVLLSYILGYTKTQILLNRNQEIPENKIEWLNQAVNKRSQGLPVAYITGHKGARSLITKFERDEILEVVFRKYLENK